MIEIKQPVNTTTPKNSEYISQIDTINEIPEPYRVLVDEIYYSFCMHPCEHTAHDGLEKVIKVLQELKDKSDF